MAVALLTGAVVGTSHTNAYKLFQHSLSLRRAACSLRARATAACSSIRLLIQTLKPPDEPANPPQPQKPLPLPTADKPCPYPPKSSSLHPIPQHWRQLQRLSCPCLCLDHGADGQEPTVTTGSKPTVRERHWACRPRLWGWGGCGFDSALQGMQASDVDRQHVQAHLQQEVHLCAHMVSMCHRLNACAGP